MRNYTGIQCGSAFQLPMTMAITKRNEFIFPTTHKKQRKVLWSIAHGTNLYFCSSWLAHSVYRPIMIVSRDIGQKVFSSAKCAKWIDSFADTVVNKGQTFVGSAIELLPTMVWHPHRMGSPNWWIYVSPFISPKEIVVTGMGKIFSQQQCICCDNTNGSRPFEINIWADNFEGTSLCASRGKHMDLNSIFILRSEYTKWYI